MEGQFLYQRSRCGQISQVKWGQVQKSIWLNACHCGADLICMCRGHHMRGVDWPFARGRQIAHVIYLHHTCQWQKEVAQTPNNWLFGAGRRVQGCSMGTPFRYMAYRTVRLAARGKLGQPLGYYSRTCLQERRFMQRQDTR